MSATALTVVENDKPTQTVADLFAAAEAAQATAVDARAAALQQFLDEAQAANRSADKLRKLGIGLSPGILEALRSYGVVADATIQGIAAIRQRGIVG